MSEDKIFDNMDRRSFLKWTAIAGSILFANTAAFNEAFAVSSSEKLVIHQILMDAMETKDIRISVRKYGDTLTMEQKNILFSLTKDDLDKLASIYKKLKPASNMRIDRRR
jgi:hypothetical protein